MSSPSGFDLQTVQIVASRYTGSAIAARKFKKKRVNFITRKRKRMKKIEANT